MQTIKSRLISIVTICLFFISLLVILYCQSIFDLQEKVVLVQRFDDLRDDLLELRRYEKNFFLAEDFSSLDKMMNYLSRTEEDFDELGNQIKNIVGKVEYYEIMEILKKYKKALNKNTSKIKKGFDDYSDFKIREYGKTLNDFTDKLIIIKRKRIERTLTGMLLVPVVFSGIFLFVFIMILRIIRKDIFEPLALLKKSTESISKGVFEPVKTSDKCDEVSRCLQAFNKMTYEIEAHQEQLLQSRKMASIGTFTSGIAHELNNPINNLSLIIDSLKEDGDTFSDKECTMLYDDLMEQADRASEIVKNLLEFSRTDQEHLVKIPLDVLIDKTVRLVKNEIHLQNIKYTKEVKGEVPSVWIDKSSLQQALLNLMINAVQAMPDGGELKVSLGPGEKETEVRIDVSDTGKGIEKEKLESVFDPFFTTKKEGEGTGLGLSVTYGIIRKHGGRISVRSTPGKGTCFSIFLNAKDKNEQVDND